MARSSKNPTRLLMSLTLPLPATAGAPPSPPIGLKVLRGNAPANTGTAQVEGREAASGRGGCGGRDETGSCGTLEYVRIEFAGYELSANNELNGLTLGGCGAATGKLVLEVG